LIDFLSPSDGGVTMEGEEERKMVTARDMQVVRRAIQKGHDSMGRPPKGKDSKEEGLSRAEIMAHNIKRYLEQAKVDQITLAKWWKCHPTYINQILRGRRALGDRAAKKFIVFLGLYGIHVTQADLLVLPAAKPYLPPPGGRIVPVLETISNLRGWRKEKVKGNGVAIVQDKDAFWLVAGHISLTGRQYPRLGDLLLVSPNAEVKDGDMVIVQAADVISVRRYRRVTGQGTVILESLRDEPPLLYVISRRDMVVYKVEQVAMTNP
jgi:hypothetical protein